MAKAKAVCENCVLRTCGTIHSSFKSDILFPASKPDRSRKRCVEIGLYVLVKEFCAKKMKKREIKRRRKIPITRVLYFESE
jgi:hypothetical protein